MYSAEAKHDCNSKNELGRESVNHAHLQDSF